jgi:glycerophosphocholine phosphodiesterase GPCPD1
VLFLNQGKTEKHIAFSDPRAQTSEMAVRFAAGTGLAGVNLHSEDLLINHEPIALAKHYGLITFVWGDELVDKSIASKFKNKFGVDGLIFDR